MRVKWFPATIVCIISLLLASALSAQQPVNKFRLSVRAGLMSGSEEYQLEKTAQGFHLTGITRMEQQGRSVEMKQELTLAPDRSLLRYKLEVQVGPQSQSVEAWPEGNAIQMRAVTAGQTQERTHELRPHTIVMDNLIASHYQVLLDTFAGQVAGNEDWWVLVPQQLAAVTGKLSAAGEEEGSLAGQPLRLRKYTINLGGVLIDFWAEASTHQLMRIFVPLQDVELVREGFALAPKPAAEEAPPSAFIAREVSFLSGELKIPGTLCLPAEHSGRLPLVVFVHGSGPHDRDETIGPNKPFRDLAQGLAAAGIASLRYDKRTFAFRTQIDPKTLTLDAEVIDDAVAALHFAQTLPEVAPRQVFLLGHSLGATLAPYIAVRAPHLRGIILMAALARPIDETIADQIAYRLRVAGQSEAAIAQQIEEMQKAFARVRSGEAANSEMIMFAPASYWRDFMQRNIPAAIRESPVPLLILQGGKDYQVKKADYDLLWQALADKPDSQREFHWFADLNHLFIPVAGESTGAEYGRPGHVDLQVIETIAHWIRQQLARTP